MSTRDERLAVIEARWWERDQEMRRRLVQAYKATEEARSTYEEGAHLDYWMTPEDERKSNLYYYELWQAAKSAELKLKIEAMSIGVEVIKSRVLGTGPWSHPKWRHLAGDNYTRAFYD